MSSSITSVKVEVGYCPHSATVYIRDPIIRAIHNYIIIIIQLLLRGGSTEGKGFAVYGRIGLSRDIGRYRAQ